MIQGQSRKWQKTIQFERDALDDPRTIGVFRVPLQQHLSDEKESPNIVADDVSSCDDEAESVSEEQDEEKLPMVIVRGPKKDQSSNALTTSTATTKRMTEELEYSSVLDAAAKTNDNWEQLAYVAVYSTTATRVNKLFNPLLGETFECDRTDDLGWKSIAGKREIC